MTDVLLRKGRIWTRGWDLRLREARPHFDIMVDGFNENTWRRPSTIAAKIAVQARGGLSPRHDGRDFEGAQQR
jgi:hypothetical protein